MTRSDFLNAWSASTPDQRFSAFVAWIGDALASYDSLIGPIDLQRDAAADPILQPDKMSYRLSPDLFTQGAPDAAADLGDLIIDRSVYLAMRAWEERQKEKQEWEKEARKQRDKDYEKMLKDAKPKGSKAGYGDYLLYLRMKELEGGSG
ncbi:hypothetical protein [Rhodophyticola sp.]|uniref:hypothetical protein n=1 Tax=Rhodophyticola sp. TaxID=2680032 RepID=UPI003D265F1C